VVGYVVLALNLLLDVAINLVMVADAIGADLFITPVLRNRISICPNPVTQTSTPS
jgi:hypothetical protein